LNFSRREAQAKESELKRPPEERKKMSKAQSILLISIIGLYAVLCVTLIFRGCVEYVHAKWPVAPRRIGKVSKAVSLTRRRRAWTRAVWRGNLAH
jgi:hypothetical protein